MIGENLSKISNNLIPCITQVAIGKRNELSVFGNNYDTENGTGVRDYIHIVDLTLGHVKALSVIENKCGFEIYNLCTEKGFSMLGIVHNLSNPLKVPYSIKPRRYGEFLLAILIPAKLKKSLNGKHSMTFMKCAEIHKIGKGIIPIDLKTKYKRKCRC